MGGCPGGTAAPQPSSAGIASGFDRDFNLEAVCFQGEFQGLGKFQGFQGRPRGPQPPEPLIQHKFKVPPVKSTKYKLLRYSRSLVAAAVAAGVAAVVLDPEDEPMEVEGAGSSGSAR